MRKTLIPLLLASALAPAAAHSQEGGEGRGWRSSAERSERAERDNDRPERARPERVERAAAADRSPEPAPRTNQSRDLERAGRSGQMQAGERQGRGERPAPIQQIPSEAQPVQEVQAPAVAQPGRQANEQPDSLVDAFRQIGRNASSGHGGGHDSHDRDDDRDWSRDWRKDRKYNWSGHRKRHRSLFRLGHYYDPYGWGYRRWSIGFSLWPSYYGSNFWLNDPWMYRLPPAYGPYRWIRYYDDALLVNIYTGHVVDVIYNFFW